jgi:hypothetical protein
MGIKKLKMIAKNDCENISATPAAIVTRNIAMVIITKLFTSDSTAGAPILSPRPFAMPMVFTKYGC